MKPLAGTWKLERWTSGVSEPFGVHPQGALVYTAGGTMMATFMRRARAPAPGDLERRLLQAALGFNAYSGRYLIEGHRVHHDVEVALYPEWIGQRLTRVFRIENERLTLSFGDDALEWTRASQV